jgi:hypothetical protein
MAQTGCSLDVVVILGTIRAAVRGEVRIRPEAGKFPPNADPRNQWKVLIVDEASRKVLDCVASEDDILNLNITSKTCALQPPPPLRRH